MALSSATWVLTWPSSRTSQATPPMPASSNVRPVLASTKGPVGFHGDHRSRSLLGAFLSILEAICGRGSPGPSREAAGRVRRISNRGPNWAAPRLTGYVDNWQFWQHVGRVMYAAYHHHHMATPLAPCLLLGGHFHAVQEF